MSGGNRMRWRAVAVAVLASAVCYAPAQAGIVTYVFNGTTVYFASSSACYAESGCIADAGPLSEALAFSYNVSVDTSLINPSGLATASWTNGSPTGFSASLQITGASSSETFNLAGTQGNWLFGFGQIVGIADTSLSSIDPFTGIPTQTTRSLSLHANLNLPVGTVNVDGVDVLSAPGPAFGLEFGQLRMVLVEAIETTLDGALLSARWRNVEFWGSITGMQVTGLPATNGGGPDPVPEPGMTGLLGLGLAMAAMARRRQT